LSKGIDQDERSCALLCSITMMGQALDLDVVVEGIERTSQLDHLRKHAHASFAQGYLMYRPMPLDHLLRVIADNRITHAPSDHHVGPDAGHTSTPNDAGGIPRQLSSAPHEHGSD
jgi:predicted signal transduction protein with EAL and GGDEF domain